MAAIPQPLNDFQNDNIPLADADAGKVYFFLIRHPNFTLLVKINF